MSSGDVSEAEAKKRLKCLLTFIFFAVGGMAAAPYLNPDKINQEPSAETAAEAKAQVPAPTRAPEVK